MLCYTAYEMALQVEKVIRKNASLVFHEDNGFEKLASSIRQNKKLEALLKTSINISNEELQEKIKTFYLNKRSHDIVLIAQGIRHTFAHGDFTSGGAGLDDAKHREIINKLAKIILRKSDSIVRECLPPLRDDFKIRTEQVKAESLVNSST